VALLQFTPTTSAYIKIDVADNGNTHISVPIEHVNSHTRCKVLETNEFLDALEGMLSIYNYDATSNVDKIKLKKEGYVGYLSYAEGTENGEFSLQIHVSKKEFKRITNILSNGNNLAQNSIGTPLHGKDLRYGTAPDDPIEWSTKINNWVHLEKCDLTFELLNNNEQVSPA
jgi:hypothetical protein